MFSAYVTLFCRTRLTLSDSKRTLSHTSPRRCLSTSEVAGTHVLVKDEDARVLPVVVFLRVRGFYARGYDTVQN